MEQNRGDGPPISPFLKSGVWTFYEATINVLQSRISAKGIKGGIKGGGN